MCPPIGMDPLEEPASLDPVFSETGSGGLGILRGTPYRRVRNPSILFFAQQGDVIARCSDKDPCYSLVTPINASLGSPWATPILRNIRNKFSEAGAVKSV